MVEQKCRTYQEFCDRAKLWVQAVQYRNFKFRLETPLSAQLAQLTIEWPVVDIRPPHEIVSVYGGQATFWHSLDTPERFFTWVWEGIQSLEDHERLESFQVNGERVWRAHTSPTNSFARPGHELYLDPKVPGDMPWKSMPNESYYDYRLRMSMAYRYPVVLPREPMSILKLSAT